VKVLDGILNVYFAFLVILFVTGGYVPGAGYGERTRAVEMWRMGPWVLSFLTLVLLRRLVDRHGTFSDIAFVRLVRGAATLLAARPRAVYLFTGVWIVVLFAVAVRQPWAFGYSPDLEVFDQALWNTAHGRLYRSSLVGDVNLLSEHFDPLNLLLAGFYLVYPSPLILLAAQAIMLGLGAIPLYWLARDRFPGSVLAPLFPILYLLYLPIREANRFGYHPGALVPPLFLFALYFMEKSRWGPMLCFLALAGLLKENMPIAGAVIGMYLLVTGRQRILGASMAAVFGLWFYAGFAWIIPAFGPLTGGYKYFDLFTRLAPTPSGVFLAPLLNPAAVAGGLAAHAERKLEYLLDVFGPLAFFSLLSPSRLVLAVPFLAPHLLSDLRFLTTVRTHHTADPVRLLLRDLGRGERPSVGLIQPVAWDAMGRIRGRPGGGRRPPVGLVPPASLAGAVPPAPVRPHGAPRASPRDPERDPAGCLGIDAAPDHLAPGAPARALPIPRARSRRRRAGRPGSAGSGARRSGNASAPVRRGREGASRQGL
jgi:hypothetical protein